MSFGINLLTFYTKYLPGDVYGNSMVIGLAALFYITAGPLAKKLESKKILTVAYSLASIGALSLLSAVSLCTSLDGGESSSGICGSLSLLVFLTRCGLNLAFCFIFIIHTELFPTSFLATSYGLCNFFGRSLTLLAPLIAESSSKSLPLSVLLLSSMIGVIGACMLRIKKVDTSEESDEDQAEFE